MQSDPTHKFYVGVIESNVVFRDDFLRWRIRANGGQTKKGITKSYVGYNGSTYG